LKTMQMVITEENPRADKILSSHRTLLSRKVFTAPLSLNESEIQGIFASTFF
jgi:hypothetical protein